MVNSVIVVGRITQDMELKQTQSGKSWVRLYLALNEGKDAQGNEQVTYVGVVAWERQAENVVKYCGKGDMIAVEGRINSSNYTTKEGSNCTSWDIVAGKITFLITKGSDKEAAKEVHDNDGPYAL